MIFINGESCDFAQPCSITDILTHRDLNSLRVAVELNGIIISQADFSTTFVSDGDKVEIVHFVGGG